MYNDYPNNYGTGQNNYGTNNYNNVNGANTGAQGTGFNTTTSNAATGAGTTNSAQNENRGYYSNYSNQYTGNNYSGTYSGANIPPTPGKKKKKMNGTFKRAMINVCMGLVFGVFAGAGIYGTKELVSFIDSKAGTQIEETLGSNTADNSTEDSTTGNETVKIPSTSGATTNNGAATTVVTDVTEVVGKVMPSVVSINNMYTETSTFFGQTTSNQAEASGSGIIVGENDTELLIATNNHVVESADVLNVQFIDDQSVEAQVKGTDATMDLAVIAVPLENIPSETLDAISIATLGDSDSLAVGEPAIAIGNALGYGQSVTTGVISAVNREITVDSVTNDLIQTDAAINPGNSGGALLNISGEVIGINSNKIGGTAIEGMGYAIPISSAKPIIEELMNKETKVKVSEDQKAYLGITGVSVTEDIATAYGMPEGVYVNQVYEGTSAESAGIQKGDIITAFDGDSVGTMEELQKELEYYAAGTSVDVTVQRSDGQNYTEATITVTLGAKNSQ